MRGMPSPSSIRPPAPGYAVVDLETTGLSPSADAILEIGLVHLDARGGIEGAWTSLVDPGPGPDGIREVGPTFIHGLTNSDVTGAPRIADLADLIARDLAGRVVVAHNARFDIGFLSHALGGLDILDADVPIPQVCTMRRARDYLTTPSRRLTACCEAAGIPLAAHHTALDDALACAGLLRHYLAVSRERGQDRPAWSEELDAAAAFTGLTWDDRRADAARPRLVMRREPGADLFHSTGAIRAH